MQIQTSAAEYSAWTEIREGIVDCLPTVFGYLSIGFTCGLISKSCGLDFWQAVGMSAFIYGGASQFIAAGMIQAAASPFSIIFTVFLVNFRHLFMSAAMSPYFKNTSFSENFMIGILLTDESFAIASIRGLKDGKLSYPWMMGLNICAYLNWVLATAIGFAFGGWIPDYEAWGLDLALVAMFAGLLVSAAKALPSSRKSMAIMSVTIFLFVLARQVFTSQVAVLVAATGGALAGRGVSLWKH